MPARGRRAWFRSRAPWPPTESPRPRTLDPGRARARARHRREVKDARRAPRGPDAPYGAPNPRLLLERTRLLTERSPSLPPRQTPDLAVDDDDQRGHPDDRIDQERPFAQQEVGRIAAEIEVVEQVEVA